MPAFEKKIYIKDESFDPIYKTVNKAFLIKTRVVPGILLALGFLVLGTQVVFPLIYLKTNDDAPKKVALSMLGVATGFSNFEFEELPTAKDAQTNDTQIPTQIPATFLLTVPKLGIKDAAVETNSTSLNPDKYLGHYKGSGMPGEPGNVFLYGHSVLPWFFNPKNYKTIFSTLDKLQAGDDLIVNYKNTILVYKVEKTEILATSQVLPTAEYKPEYLNESTITLMTCWPAGTRAKRLLVRGVLTN